MWELAAGPFQQLPVSVVGCADRAFTVCAADVVDCDNRVEQCLKPVDEQGRVVPSRSS
jgi:hypothetical protein